MKEEIIIIPIVNNTPEPIPNGKAVYFNETTNTIEMCNGEEPVLQIGRYEPRPNWFRRLFRLKQLYRYVVKDLNTSQFKKGDKVYLDPDNPGALITKE